MGIKIFYSNSSSVNKKYFETMYNAKIVVTVNPSDWEGDFRLWETLATGAMVMVDPIYAPHPFPLLDGIHVVFFSNNNKTLAINNFHSRGLKYN